MRGVQTWIDESYGLKGFKIWIIFISWLGLLYILFFLFVELAPSFLIKGVSTLLLGIDLILMLVYTGLFLGGGLFILQCKKTAYEITTDDMISFNAYLYLWGKVRFTDKDIKSFDVHHLKGIKKYITPFESNHKNYRINLINGDFFYVAGSLKNISSFIGSFKSRNKRSLLFKGEKE